MPQTLSPLETRTQSAPTISSERHPAASILGSSGSPRRFATQRHVVETVGDPRPVMPTVTLSPEEREDVVAYILAFQRPDAPASAPPAKLEPFE